MIQLKYRFFGVPLVFYLAQICLLDYLLRGYLAPIYTEQGYLLVQALQFSVNPALLFLASYFLGKKVNLKDELPVVIYSLFLGSLIGSLFLWGFRIALSNPTEIHDLYLYALNFSFHISQGLQVFFTSFAATAMAYLRKSKHGE